MGGVGAGVREEDCVAGVREEDCVAGVREEDCVAGYEARSSLVFIKYHYNLFRTELWFFWKHHQAA